MTTNKIPRLSPSIAKVLLDQSPKHAWQEHWLLGGTKQDAQNDALEALK